MKKIYLIGFRGTGFRNPMFKNEPALVRAGHVGFFFEGMNQLIFGFHPTPEAVETIGGEDEVIQWLKEKKTLDGMLQDDYVIFVRAFDLSQLNAKTTVWQLAIEVSDEDFERIYQQTMTWYTEKEVFTYSFPPDEPMPDRDNCATFPRKLGLPILDPVGQIKDYMHALARQGQPWRPRGN